jgi:hypothetical protein
MMDADRVAVDYANVRRVDRSRPRDLPPGNGNVRNHDECQERSDAWMDARQSHNATPSPASQVLPYPVLNPRAQYGAIVTFAIR